MLDTQLYTQALDTQKTHQSWVHENPLGYTTEGGSKNPAQLGQFSELDRIGEDSAKATDKTMPPQHHSRDIYNSFGEISRPKQQKSDDLP